MDKDKYQVDGTVITPAKSQRPVDLANFESADDLVDFMQAMCNDVSEEDVYNIISGIYENKEAITKAYSKGAELDLQSASAITSVPYHPGAAKYYAEKGITVPVK